ncbi:hypothetical protein [Burkholderia territorii]|uniref:hypothetical protein n=1 Tax=Burkholderia territorii TaxID=1503055 RepID=UPI0009BCE3C1|nr:hypothetical protein [Burkholderia territorii]
MVSIDISILESGSESEVEAFWTSFERHVAADDGAAARSHLRAGRPIYISDPRHPGKVIRKWPDGSLELMEFDTTDLRLIVECNFPSEK